MTPPERALQAIETNGYPVTVVGLLVNGEPIIERRFTSCVPLGVHLHQDDTARVMDRAMRDLRAEHPRCWLALAVHYLLPSRYTDEQKADCVAIFGETFWDFRVTKRSQKLATSCCLRRPGRPNRKRRFNRDLPRSSRPDPTRGPDIARR